MPANLEQASVDLAESLRTVAVNSAYNASRALSKWFKRGVRLTSEGFESLPLSEVVSAACDPEDAVVAAHMALDGELGGDVLLVFREKTAMHVVDMMIGAPEGTTKTIGDLEASCIQETGNIVATSFTNSLAGWLNVDTVPAAPTVVHDMACAVIEPLLISQAEIGDTALVSRTEFELDGKQMDWFLLLLPSAAALTKMRSRCDSDEFKRNALHTIAINGAFNASRAMSKWLHRGVRLSTEGFERVPLRDICQGADAGSEVAALHLELGSQMHGHTLMVMSRATALELVDVLTQKPEGTTKEFDEMARSCLQETGNIVSSAFINSWAKWLDIHTAPQPPQLHVDMLEAILQAVVIEQASVSDEVFLAKTSFSVDGKWLDWKYYVLPTPISLRLIETSMH